MGIVLSNHPLTVVVPTHLLVLLDEEDPIMFEVDGSPCGEFRVLRAPVLERDAVSVIQFPRCRRAAVRRVHLPKRAYTLRPEQEVTLDRAAGDPSARSQGRVLGLKQHDGNGAVALDLDASPGESGSAVLVDGRLVAVCQGRIPEGKAGRAIAIPLSPESLAELRRIRSTKLRICLRAATMIATLALLAVGGLAAHSARSFSLAAVEVAEDGSGITARNGDVLTLRPSWSRSFPTPVRRVLTFAERVSAAPNRVAVGTICHEGVGGILALLDNTGRTRWTYGIPDGECIYSTDDATYDGYVVDFLYACDLNQDGQNELLAVFVHDHAFPSKLVVFNVDGHVLCDYWHPGYIRNLANGLLGSSREPITVLSASNNMMKTTAWNPQVLFAFRGLDIAGQGPPYVGRAAQGTELWYLRIDNPEPLRIRAKAYQYEFRDVDEDARNEVRVALTDSRFYYLDESGHTVRVEVGDYWGIEFGIALPPPLAAIPLRGGQRRSAESPAEATAQSP